MSALALGKRSGQVGTEYLPYICSRFKKKLYIWPIFLVYGNIAIFIPFLILCFLNLFGISMYYLHREFNNTVLKEASSGF